MELEEKIYLYLLFILPILGLLFLYNLYWKRKKQLEFGDLEMVKKFKNGRGPAMALFTDTLMTQKLQKSLNEIERASKNLNDASRDLSATMRKVEKGKSPAGVVLTDSLSAEHMRQTLVNIEQGTARFNENMEAMKHNWLFKGYFKDQEKEKKKAEKK